MQPNCTSPSDIPPAPAARAKARVCLVGAGPGDPELLNVKAVNRLRNADVVLHDALVSPDVLALVLPSTRVLNVGKRCGHKSITQSEINSLLVSFATEGNLVVRLKSGDPLLFGRAGEEIDALRQNGIDVEIVPGITAAVAAAASAQISLTDRRYAEQVLLVSAHQAPGKAGPDWGGLISSGTTIVVYMPGQTRDVAEGLIHAGLSGHTPCIVISKISLPEEQSHRTTLGSMCGSVQPPAPCLLIIGETVATSTLTDSGSPHGRSVCLHETQLARLRSGLC
jgi:uroporphyrin-III C-methyltransferase